MIGGTGPLLRTGNIKDYAALGEEGNPVYKWATQIRVAIKRKVDPESARYFAVPQSNENGDVIDWYAPRTGSVIPWSAASREEKISAKEQLESFKQELDLTVEEIRNGEGADQGVFNRLLEHVLQFPNDEHVYLVAGKPVLTFWGFVDTDANPRPDPLSVLVIPESAGMAEAAALPFAGVESSPVRRKSFWWWLLPLLFLLLLLLFLLRGCDDPVEIRELRGLFDAQTVEPPLHREHDPIEMASGNRYVVNERGSDDLPLSKNESDGESALPFSESEAENPQDILPDQQVLDEATVPAADDSDEQAQQADALDDATEAQQPDPVSPQDAPVESEVPGPQPLAIPDDPAQQNSMDFLNGRWQANSGLMDKQGRPVNLEYEFKDGKGNVRIKRNDGSVCSGAVEATRKGKELAFSDQESIKCQGGGSYRPAKVKCKVDAGGETVCEGAYSSGDSFKMDIKKASDTE